MSGDGSPPSSWYDPPEPRHRDGSRIPDECNCSECHAFHIENGEVVENSDNTDFQCCVDQMEIWIEDKERCPKHPKAYAEPNKDLPGGIYCEECDQPELKLEDKK